MKIKLLFISLIIIIILLLYWIMVFIKKNFHGDIKKSPYAVGLIVKQFAKGMDDKLRVLVDGNKGKKYKMKIGNISFTRSGDIKIDADKLKACMEHFTWGKDSKISYDYFESNTYSDLILQFLFHKDVDYYLIVDLVVYNDFNDADMWFKSGFKDPEIRQYLPGIEDVAFIPILKYWRAGAVILYSNVLIGLDISSSNAADFRERRPEAAEIEKVYNTQHQIYLDFIHNFYPYFRQCAEQAKVSVQEEKN